MVLCTFSANIVPLEEWRLFCLFLFRSRSLQKFLEKPLQTMFQLKLFLLLELKLSHQSSFHLFVFFCTFFKPKLSIQPGFFHRLY